VRPGKAREPRRPLWKGFLERKGCGAAKPSQAQRWKCNSWAGTSASSEAPNPVGQSDLGPRLLSEKEGSRRHFTDSQNLQAETRPQRGRLTLEQRLQPGATAHPGPDQSA
jgi:hypothetical protein